VKSGDRLAACPIAAKVKSLRLSALLLIVLLLSSGFLTAQHSANHLTMTCCTGGYITAGRLFNDFNSLSPILFARFHTENPEPDSYRRGC
jgi:hypothetical protein